MVVVLEGLFGACYTSSQQFKRCGVSCYAAAIGACTGRHARGVSDRVEKLVATVEHKRAVRCRDQGCPRADVARNAPCAQREIDAVKLEKHVEGFTAMRP